jgi:twinkle protein
MLEAKPKDVAVRIAGKAKGKTFHIPGTDRTDLREALVSLVGKVEMYDSFGQTEWSRIKSVMRHMHLAMGIRVFYLDHLTAMADTKDERGSLEQITKEMSGFANELNILLHCVSHLATPDGTPHEEGGRVMIRHFKGARAIGFWSHTMIGLERDQQADDPTEQLKTTVRILKHRYFGPATGKTFDFGYQPETGILVPWKQMGFDEDPKEEIAF